MRMFDEREGLSLTLTLMSVLLPLAAGKNPNILLMIADDLGIGDIGCYGNTTLRTPHIDSIARQGVQLNQHLAAESVCTPSRAAFLTGRYPIRSGTASGLGLPVFFYVASSGGLPQTEVSFGRLAEQAGYSTGFIGKWHLGWSRDKFNDFHHHPRNHGFEYFYGLPLSNMRDFGNDGQAIFHQVFPYMVHRMLTVVTVFVFSILSLFKTGHLGGVTCSVLLVLSLGTAALLYFLTTARILNSVIYRNFDLVEQPIDLATQMRKEVIEGQEFIRARRADDKPFLLVMSWMHVHTFLEPGDDFLGRSKHGKYGDSVEELDWAVGQMLQSLSELGLEDNTLVYFTSDHGGHLEDINKDGELEGGYNSIYKGGKGHGAVDGGIRVPGLMKWPGQIPAASTSSEPTSLMDLLPTLATIMKMAPPSDRQMDGRDILPLLTGRVNVSPHDFLFHYCGVDVHAVRYRPRDGSTTWKLVLKEPAYNPGVHRCDFTCQCKTSIVLDPPNLLDMTSDPGESQPISVSDHPDIYRKMMEALREHQEGIEPVTPQFTPLKLIWRPWLQMCCNNNYPSCSCQDEKFKGMFS